MPTKLSGRQKSELAYLKRRQPLWWKAPPDRADGDLWLYLEYGLVEWVPERGYYITPDGIMALAA